MLGRRSPETTTIDKADLRIDSHMVHTWYYSTFSMELPRSFLVELLTALGMTRSIETPSREN